MSRDNEKAWEALTTAACALMMALLVGAYLMCCLLCGIARREPAPYSVCERCGQPLAGTNTVCAPERAEGSGK